MIQPSGIEREKWLLGSVRPTHPPHGQQGLDVYGALTEGEYQDLLNAQAHGIREHLGIALDQITPDRISMLRQKTLQGGRREMRRTLETRLSHLRRNQAHPEHPNEFIKQVHEDVMQRLRSLLGPDFSENRYDIRLHSAAQTLLDFLGGVDCFVDLVEKSGGKETPLASCMVDVKSRNKRGKPQHQDKMTDLFFFYDPLYVQQNWISPHLFTSRDYKEFIDQLAHFLAEKVRFSGRF